MNNLNARRPLRSRQTGWAGWLLGQLLRTSITANQISLAGILFAILGAGAMLLAPPHPWLWLVAALFVQGRLVANLMDGLVAVEGGRGAPTGAIWNEAPDRLEDTLLLVAFGYAIGIGWLGWLAAVLAAICAYVRLLGGTLALTQDFVGPFAKQQRMAFLTVASILSAPEAWFLGTQRIALIALTIVAIGTALTIGRRLRRQARALEERAQDHELRLDVVP